MSSNQLNIIQIALSVILIISILFQSRGSGLSSTFGGQGGEFYRSKRGIEKFLYYETILVAILFATSALLSLVVK